MNKPMNLIAIINNVICFVIGCGKTTFLDLLTGRRRPGQIEVIHVYNGWKTVLLKIILLQGEIFVNGVPMDSVQDEYLSSTGYVLQSATPYYEELTVRLVEKWRL